MTDEQKAFIKENKQRMTKSQRYTVGELTMIYQIYNSITGESKTKSTCGRCLQNTINVILNNYKQYEDKSNND